MKTRQTFLTIMAFTAILGIALLAFAQSSQWGGKGHVSTSSSKIGAGKTVTITYKVTDSSGTGTAGFNCEVTNPNGAIHKASKGSTEWSGGTAEASFTYPDDFGGSQIPCTTQDSGKYEIRCYWYIAGYGVDGATAAATGKFHVE